MLNDTADRLAEDAAPLIVQGGYNGFSHVDLAQRLGIRTAGIHDHYPTKVDPVVAVVDQARADTRTDPRPRRRFGVGPDAALTGC